MAMLKRLCEYGAHRDIAYAAASILVSGMLFVVPAVAQVNDVRLPITVDADSTNYDGKTSMLTFQGLRITQGNIGIQADTGRASKLDFEDSTWKFSGSVIIDTEQGHIECDSADLEFKQHELKFATITGTPATFELHRSGTDETTYAQAARLYYDFAAGIVEFSGNAVITEGGNQISSSFLVYNIEEQRINAQSGGDGDPRVKITYTPRAGVNGTDSVPAGNATNDLAIQDDSEDQTEDGQETGDSGQ